MNCDSDCSCGVHRRNNTSEEQVIAENDLEEPPDMEELALANGSIELLLH
jgi:hypothetical protein